MKKIRMIFCLLGILSFFCFTACESPTDSQLRQKPTRDNATESNLPWNKPADWEGGMPGMPTNNMQRNY